MPNYKNNSFLPPLNNTNNPRNGAPVLYVHHSEVPQSVVAANPAEWYLPSSEETIKSYSSKKIPTFTPSPGWTDQEYLDNRKNYENQINGLRTLYNKALMSAKDLKYSPVSAGSGPLDPIPLQYVHPAHRHSPSWIIDAKGNRVNDFNKYNKGRDVDRVKYDPSGDKSGDAFSYNSDLDGKVYGFKHNTVSDLRDWKYNPHKAAMHPDYATRQGNIASWDRVEGVPTVSKVMPVRDGNEYTPVLRTLPDYSASLDRFTHTNDNNTTRLPNSSGNVTIDDLEASGLLSKPQTIQYLSTTYGKNNDGTWGYAQRQSSEENARTARLQDLLTDRLLVPDKVDKSVLVSELLSDAIGDARKDAILNTATSNNWNHRQSFDSLKSALQTQIFGRAHLAGTDNLSLPITFVDDIHNDGENMNYTGDNLYTYLYHAFPLSSVDPRYKMYRDDGVIRVFTDANSASWSPGSSKIELSEPDQLQRNADLLNTMRASSGANKFNTGTAIGADYHHNDLPANGFSDGDIRNALLHEGIHASTGFNSNVIESQDLRNARILYDSMSDDVKGVSDENYWKERTRLWGAFHDLKHDPAHKVTALGAVLGVGKEDPNKTSRGYASNSEAEMLRALHHAKSGLARHLISENKMSPEEVVETVQNPDKFLDFMQDVYKGSIKGLNDDPTSYSFPSSMSQVGTENEMARSIAGIQPLILTLLETRKRERARLLNKSPLLEENDWSSPSQKDNHIFKNEDGDPSSIQWKELIYTPEEQLLNFRNKIWPQVHNNNNTDKYKTLS